MLAPVTSLGFIGFGGFWEWFLILTIGILLFGRNLPDVGRQLGKTLGELRRHVDQFKAELHRDESLREATKGLKEASRDLRGAGDSLRDLKRTANPVSDIPTPKSVFDDLARSARTSELPNQPAAGTTTNGSAPESSASEGSAPEDRAPESGSAPSAPAE